MRKRDDRAGGLTLADLLGSSRIKYSPDAVLFLVPRPGKGPLPATCRPVSLRLAKGRDGMTCTTIPLLFEYTRYRFWEEGGAQIGKPHAGGSEPASTAAAQGVLVGDPEE